MRYLTHADATGAPRVAVLVDDEHAVDLQTLLPDWPTLPSDLKLLIADEELQRAVREAVAKLDARVATPLHELRLLAPLKPGKIVGVGLNYDEHVEESSRSLDTANERPPRPVLFSKPATAVVGPGAAIVHNGGLTEQLDWECELGVVIGRRAKGVRVETAMEHVFGYTVVNDISARDQRRSGQWFFSKGQDTYAPLGPVVVTVDEVSDPHALSLRLTVNGVEKQNGTSAHMIFRIPDLIADISSGMTLEPGDVIATGSPSGVGAGRTPPEFLWPGDLVEATVERVGTLSNPVEAAS